MLRLQAVPLFTQGWLKPRLHDFLLAMVMRFLFKLSRRQCVTKIACAAMPRDVTAEKITENKLPGIQ